MTMPGTYQEPSTSKRPYDLHGPIEFDVSCFPFSVVTNLTNFDDINESLNKEPKDFI